MKVDKVSNDAWDDFIVMIRSIVYLHRYASGSSVGG